MITHKNIYISNEVIFNPQIPSIEAGYGFTGNGKPENNQYFYHSDHLGSTSYITDRQGNAEQFIVYMPYGEVLTEEHGSWESPYRFNGKELDAETGLYYYGARYYEPQTAMWYGVDPMAEKYPNVGGYVYCVGNPVRLIDPDGMEAEEIGEANNTLEKLHNTELANINALKNIDEGLQSESVQSGSSQQQPQPPPKQTLQQQLATTLSKTKVGESISGKKLGEAIGNSDISLGVSKVTRTEESTFKIDRTVLAASTGIIKKGASMKITEEPLNSKPAIRIKIDGYSKTLIKNGALPDFYIQGDKIYFYGEDGKLYQGSTGEKK
jgi:RHS repeat-associated protein